MCKLCETKPVYEFTNRRKLCARCFVNYFEKKVLYTVRKFDMVNSGDVIGYKEKKDFKGTVLKEILNFISDKSNFDIVKLPNKRANKIAVDSSIDSEAVDVSKKLIERTVSELKRDLPVEGKIIKPLYLFLDDEILLYAKIKKLKFKQIKENKNKINHFLDEFEKKHPEVKRAIVNSLLELYQ